MIPGAMEILLVLVLIAVFFGAGKLPAVMGVMGEGVKQFRDAQKAAGDAKKSLLGEDGDPEA